MGRPNCYVADLKLEKHSLEQRNIIYKLFSHGTIIYQRGGSWLLGDVFHECDQVYLFQDCIAFHADGKFSFYSQKEDKIKEAGGLLGINLEPRLNDIFHKEQEKFFKYYEERNEDPQVKNPLEKVV